MEQLLFIVLAVVIIFALLYKWKKRTEKKMGNDLNALIEANDSTFIFHSSNCDLN